MLYLRNCKLNLAVFRTIYYKWTWNLPKKWASEKKWAYKLALEILYGKDKHLSTKKNAEPLFRYLSSCCILCVYACSFFVCLTSALFFLTFWHDEILQAHLLPKSWRQSFLRPSVPKTKIWAWGVLVAASWACQLTEGDVCVSIHPHKQTCL